MPPAMSTHRPIMYAPKGTSDPPACAAPLAPAEAPVDASVDAAAATGGASQSCTASVAVPVRISRSG